MVQTMDTERWYYLEGETPVGPFMRERLLDLFKAQIIGPHTYVWREGTPEWICLADTVRRQQTPPAPPPIPPPPISRNVRGDASSTDATSIKRPIPAQPHPTAIQNDLNGAFIERKHVWSPHPVAPWRRYGARTLDTTIHGTLGYILFAFAWYTLAPTSADEVFSFLTSENGRLVEVLLGTFIAVLVGAIVVGLTGGSVGKAVFGVKVVKGNGETIGVTKGLCREFQVWWAGIALGIPLIAVFTMLRAYQKLKDRGTTSWDSRFGTVVLHRPNGPLQYFLNGVGIILIILSTGVAVALSRMK